MNRVYLKKPPNRQKGTSEGLLQGMHGLLASKHKSQKKPFVCTVSVDLSHSEPLTNLTGKKSISKTKYSKAIEHN